MDESGVAKLPGAEDGEDQPSVILHVDVDCFYAACERLRRPELRDEPVVVGMGFDVEEKNGVVATASYEAREYGVESAMPIGESLDRLPRKANADKDCGEDPDPDESGYYVPVDMEYYKTVSGHVREVLNERAEVLEPVSVDEAYLDVTERIGWSNASEFGRKLKTEIEEAAGVTASVGVAATKSAAKVASDRDKPDGLVVVEPGEVREFFEPLGIEQVHGIGPVTAEKLRERGVETAGDLASSDPSDLEAVLGSRGRELYRRVHGHDPRKVSPPDDPKSLSRETSFGDPVNGMETKESTIERLSGSVAERAKEKGAFYRTIGIKVVTPPFDVNTRSQSLSGPVDDPEIVESVALELLEEFDEAPVRKIGVRVSNLEFSERQQGKLSRWGGEEPRKSGKDMEGDEKENADLSSSIVADIAPEHSNGKWRQLTLGSFGK
ncbi:MAG: DNA polymerase IV [Halobacteria archaeon]